MMETEYKTEYQFWNAPKSGETYAVRITNDVVEDICGLLYYYDVSAADLLYYHYLPVNDDFNADDWTYDERTKGDA